MTGGGGGGRGVLCGWGGGGGGGAGSVVASSVSGGGSGWSGWTGWPAAAACSSGGAAQNQLPGGQEDLALAAGSAAAVPCTTSASAIVVEKVSCFIMAGDSFRVFRARHGERRGPSARRSTFPFQFAIPMPRSLSLAALKINAVSPLVHAEPRKSRQALRVVTARSASLAGL
jgi:hypothetical protein